MSQGKRNKILAVRGVIKPIVRPLLLWIFNAGEFFRKGLLPTPILAYHSLDKSGSLISLDPDIFQQQIAFLASRRYKVLTLSEYGRYLREGRKLPIPSVVLTFDDGFANFLEEGYPALKKYGYRATIFIQTDYIGKKSSFSKDLSFQIMGYSDLRFLQKEGFEFGAHTCSHVSLTGIPLSRARTEIVKSKEILGEVLGEEVTSFCYPFGDYNQKIEEIVQGADYQTAVTLDVGNTNSRKNLLALRRVAIGPRIVPVYFKLILGGNFQIYHNLFQLPFR